MKTHTIIDEKILPIDLYDEVKQIIRNHHERIDGKGYPDKLHNIPCYVKIISITDCFDAMTSKRNYNKVKSLNEAIQELVISSIPQIKDNGTFQQLNTNLTKIFINMLLKNKDILNFFNLQNLEDIKKIKLI